MKKSGSTWIPLLVGWWVDGHLLSLWWAGRAHITHCHSLPLNAWSSSSCRHPASVCPRMQNVSRDDFVFAGGHASLTWPLPLLNAGHPSGSPQGESNTSFGFESFRLQTISLVQGLTLLIRGKVFCKSQSSKDGWGVAPSWGPVQELTTGFPFSPELHWEISGSFFWVSAVWWFPDSYPFGGNPSLACHSQLMPFISSSWRRFLFRVLSKSMVSIFEIEKCVIAEWTLHPCFNEGDFLFFLVGILSTFGNGYVLYMSSRRKKKLRPAEIMTVNLAICDLGISGKADTPFLLGAGGAGSPLLKSSLACRPPYPHFLLPLPSQIIFTELGVSPWRVIWLKRSFMEHTLSPF